MPLAVGSRLDSYEIIAPLGADGNIYLIGMEGGQPQAITNEGKSGAPDWSPDGNLILFATTDGGRQYLSLFDLRAGKKSVVPGANSLVGARWIGDDKLLSVWEDVTVFDIKTQRQVQVGVRAQVRGQFRIGCLTR